jgi:dTDP-3-amino-2,3,6-trideoxy-4-keto-D-glucose/dTDP-3-amino-3,4,6-trideoxy-alpha-D-glucose/dTDP-2,6-dideoxy-D-kanosamine transaminase
MTTLLNDLARHNKQLRRELDLAIGRVLDGGWYILGNEVQNFESEFAAYCTATHCVAVANGTDAIEIALRALGVVTGDEVLTVANAGGFGTVAIHALGARPRFVDVDPIRLTMSPEDLEKKVTSATRAIIVTHLFGRLADIESILRVARTHGIPVLEDSAQAHGASRGGKRAGSFGDVGTFSFYPAKNLGALGDGGAIVTSDATIASVARKLRNYGWDERYRVAVAGGRNSRLDELQAAILRVKLPYLDDWNDRRRRVAMAYRRLITSSHVALPADPDEEDVVHLFVVRVRRRASLMDHLDRNNVPCGIYYPVDDTMQAAWSKSGDSRDIPNTRVGVSQVLALPCFPEITESEVRKIADVVDSWIPEC